MYGKVNEMMQLIFYDLTFNENFGNHIEQTGIKQVGKDFNTLAIIGCQSSGKSTLLNKLFETNFEVMADEKGRGQTTQGIWVAMNKEYKVMILDCEGTDSKERGEDRFRFEHCSSLFALAMADVLIINMWTNDVGRYTASNYGVLKIVFEMNLKLFQQECAKKILIVLRDFDERYDVKEKITELILQDILAIWKEIKKPERYKDYSPNRFFEFEFTTLPHKFYFEEKFDEETALLRNRLMKNNSEYLFKHVATEKNVPIDGMSHYCNQLWNDIISNKDLNIPSQKEMLANFKCNEIKQNAIQSVQNEIELLSADSAAKLLDNFKNRCERIQKLALDIYDDTAKNYLTYVYQEIRRQLIMELSQKLYLCFENQIKKLIPVSQKNMRQELKKELKIDPNFFRVATNIKKIYLTNLLKQIEVISLFSYWDNSINEYEMLFDEIIENERKTCLEEKQAEIIKKLKTIMIDALIEKLEEINPNFWIGLNEDFFTHFNSMVLGFKESLIEYFKMEDKEFIPMAQAIEENIYNSIKKEFHKKLKEIPSYAKESFRRRFWYDESIPRTWNKMNEVEIDKLFEKVKRDNSYVFDLLKEFKLIKNPLKYLNYRKQSEDDFMTIFCDIKIILNDKLNKELDSLYNENEISSLKMKYEECISNILVEAKEKHANIQKQSVPLWAWLLILYLGYEDVLIFVSSYWIIPVIILLSIYGVLCAMGMGNMPKTIFKLIKKSLFQKWLNLF